MSRSWSVKCRCVTRWIIDFGDDRGEAPTDAMTAATAVGLGLPVRLGSASTTPFKPVVIEGMHYGDSPTVARKRCDVCGWPVRTEKW